MPLPEAVQEPPNVGGIIYERPLGSCKGVSFSVTISINRGSPTALGGLPTGGYGQFDLEEPCRLNPPSDLPGTRVTVAMQTQNGGHDTAVATLGRDTAAPQLEIHSKPPTGHTVRVGERIKVTVDATEVRSSGSWETGVRTVELLSPDGRVGQQFQNPSKGPLPCKQKMWTHRLTATYTVPKTPGSLLHLVARADDYAGNQAFRSEAFRVAGHRLLRATAGLPPPTHPSRTGWAQP
jgi:hypothetical protein